MKNQGQFDATNVQPSLAGHLAFFADADNGPPIIEQASRHLLAVWQAGARRHVTQRKMGNKPTAGESVTR